MNISVCNPIFKGRVSEFSGLEKTLDGMTSTSLELIRKIDGTVDGLGNLERSFNGLCESVAAAAERARSAPIESGKFLSSPEELEDMERVVEKSYVLLNQMVIANQSVDRDPELNADQRELLHSAFNTFISAVANANHAFEDLIEIVASHDLDVEGATDRPSFTDGHALINSVLSAA